MVSQRPFGVETRQGREGSPLNSTEASGKHPTGQLRLRNASPIEGQDSGQTSVERSKPADLQGFITQTWLVLGKNLVCNLEADI